MFNKIKTLTAVSSRRLAPPDAITLKEGYTTLSRSAGAAGGTGYGSLLHILCF